MVSIVSTCIVCECGKYGEKSDMVLLNMALSMALNFAGATAAQLESYPKAQRPHPASQTPHPASSLPCSVPPLAVPVPRLAAPVPRLAAPVPRLAAPAPRLAGPAPPLAAPVPRLAAPAPRLAAPAPRLAAPALQEIVQLCGLEGSNKQLNGICGLVSRFDNAIGRYSVTLLATEKTYDLKPKNLRLIPAGSSEVKGSHAAGSSEAAGSHAAGSHAAGSREVKGSNKERTGGEQKR
mgnify:CR=1 FL=1